MTYVAPWSMLGIITFGFFASIAGFGVAAFLCSTLMVVGTCFFPKSGIAASTTFKASFVVAMVLCFLCIIFLPTMLPQGNEKVIWFSSYFLAVAAIEAIGLILERSSHAV